MPSPHNVGQRRKIPYEGAGAPSLLEHPTFITFIRYSEVAMLRSSHFARTAVICALVACSDGSATTQPAAGGAVSPGRKPSTDVGIATPTAATVIYACYVAGKGTMYRIKTSDTPAECDKKDVEFSWTERSGSIEGVVFASAAATLPSDGRYFAECPDGKSVLNFGYEITINSTGTTSQILSNRPTLSGGRTGWVFRAAPGTTYVFYWNCAPMETVTAVL